MKFHKMHGIGNDYIYFNLFEEKIDNPSELAVKLSDRHFGIGGDGIVLIGDSDIADFSMRIFNADGSEAEMCGNASRCVGKYVYDLRLTNKMNLSLETKSGIKYLILNKDTKSDTIKSVLVNMGKAITNACEIPIASDLFEVINQPLIVDNKTFHITCLSMGNPHAVVFVDDVNTIEIEKLGPLFENHPMFPNHINTEFVEIIDRETIKMRVWERGSGETLACGTGSCASVVAGVLNNLCDCRVTVKLTGGDLYIAWDKTINQVYMTGDAEFVFEGEI